jgi:DNA-binding CsgD family transcriptional regulator
METRAWTLRELQVVRLVARGMTTQQVARRLTLSPRTVDNHVASAMRKVDVGNRVMLVRYAIAHELVT